MAEPSRTTGQIKAVCLDIDDTLVDSERASREGLRALVGTDRAWQVWRRITDEHFGDHAAGDGDFDATSAARTRAFFAAFGHEIDDAELARRESDRMAAMRRAWRLFDDALPCLDWLRATGLRLVAITNAPSAYQRRKMADVGLAGTFDTVLLSEEVGAAKPDSRIFAAACGGLGLRPEEVVHVGDRLDADAVGAVRAGMHGIWLDRRDTGRTAPDGVRVISSLFDLPELLVCDLPAVPGPTAAPAVVGEVVGLPR
ncbi:HAD family hydrolase [Saccharopolyspora sp. CA-218241]|uniref:HAD family hydrolase n=1 Tax=Saccharopolyspora sp. CA-218241 TaxID=3240027 RepID=UPI003D99FE7C